MMGLIGGEPRPCVEDRIGIRGCRKLFEPWSKGFESKRASGYRTPDQVRPAFVPGWVLEGEVELGQVLPTAHGDGPQAHQVSGDILAVDQVKPPGRQPAAKGVEGELGGVRGAENIDSPKNARPKVSP